MDSQLLKLREDILQPSVANSCAITRRIVNMQDVQRKLDCCVVLELEVVIDSIKKKIGSCEGDLWSCLAIIQDKELEVDKKTKLNAAVLLKCVYGLSQQPGLVDVDEKIFDLKRAFQQFTDYTEICVALSQIYLELAQSRVNFILIEQARKLATSFEQLLFIVKSYPWLSYHLESIGKTIPLLREQKHALLQERVAYIKQVPSSFIDLEFYQLTYDELLDVAKKHPYLVNHLDYAADKLIMFTSAQKYELLSERVTYMSSYPHSLIILQYYKLNYDELLEIAKRYSCLAHRLDYVVKDQKMILTSEQKYLLLQERAKYIMANHSGFIVWEIYTLTVEELMHITKVCPELLCWLDDAIRHVQLKEQEKLILLEQRLQYMNSKASMDIIKLDPYDLTIHQILYYKAQYPALNYTDRLTGAMYLPLEIIHFPCQQLSTYKSSCLGNIFMPFPRYYFLNLDIVNRRFKDYATWMYCFVHNKVFYSTYAPVVNYIMPDIEKEMESFYLDPSLETCENLNAKRGYVLARIEKYKIKSSDMTNYVIKDAIQHFFVKTLPFMLKKYKKPIQYLTIDSKQWQKNITILMTQFWWRKFSYYDSYVIVRLSQTTNAVVDKGVCSGVSVVVAHDILTGAFATDMSMLMSKTQESECFFTNEGYRSSFAWNFRKNVLKFLIYNHWPMLENDTKKILQPIFLTNGYISLIGTTASQASLIIVKTIKHIVNVVMVDEEYAFELSLNCISKVKSGHSLGIVIAKQHLFFIDANLGVFKFRRKDQDLFLRCIQDVLYGFNYCYYFNTFAIQSFPILERRFPTPSSIKQFVRVNNMRVTNSLMHMTYQFIDVSNTMITALYSVFNIMTSDFLCQLLTKKHYPAKTSRIFSAKKTILLSGISIGVVSVGGLLLYSYKNNRNLIGGILRGALPKVYCSWFPKRLINVI